MSDLTATMSAELARRLTDEVKADAAALWSKLARLHDEAAHLALGYSSWAAYCAAEFTLGRSHSYRLLEAARVVADLAQSPMGDSESPANEAQARALAAVPEPDRAEVWREASERAQREERPVTARDVGEVYDPGPSLARDPEYLPHFAKLPRAALVLAELASAYIALEREAAKMLPQDRARYLASVDRMRGHLDTVEERLRARPGLSVAR